MSGEGIEVACLEEHQDDIDVRDRVEGAVEEAVDNTDETMGSPTPAPIREDVASALGTGEDDPFVGKARSMLLPKMGGRLEAVQIIYC